MFFPPLHRQGNYPRTPDGGFFGYAHYREHVAVDCQRRCVYCDAQADDVGGADAMQLDHFRPESFAEFALLINDPLNLHYSCGRCNLLKSNHWPARGSGATHNGKDGFIDPFAEDRLAYFGIDADGRIGALQPPAGYMIRLLRLDREFLRKLREARRLRAVLRMRVGALRMRIARGGTVDAAELDTTLAAVEALLGQPGDAPDSPELHGS
jgi:hypothetical protein